MKVSKTVRDIMDPILKEIQKGSMSPGSKPLTPIVDEFKNL